MIDTPNVDWLALSPTLALLAVSALTLLGGVFYPRHAVRSFVVFVSVAGFAASAVCPPSSSTAPRRAPPSSQSR